jgi:hypothetical protein
MSAPGVQPRRSSALAAAGFACRCGLVPVLLLASSCSAGAESEPAQVSAAEVVYAEDDRIEVFEASDAVRQRASASVVALVPRSLLEGTGGKLSTAATFADSLGFCERERFAEQPSAAFCTGVLVDWDLVLTAGHCASLLPLDEIAIVPGYYYADERRIPSDSAAPLAVVDLVAKRVDPPTSTVRLDYAWLRLDRPVTAPYAPAPVRRAATPLRYLAPLTAVNAGGGLPLKIDAGGRVWNPRPDTLDCFLGDTDTLHGASGGAAFDDDLSLVGVMVRGAEDVVWDADGGCWLSLQRRDGSESSEQYTYTHRALEGLCSLGEEVSSLCRPSCGEPCQALPAEEARNAPDGAAIAGRSAGCSLARPRSREAAASLLLAVSVLLARRRAGAVQKRALRRSPGPSRSSRRALAGEAGLQTSSATPAPANTAALTKPMSATVVAVSKRWMRSA